jgi:hypothetical protein
VRGMVSAQLAVAELVEMRADDVAASAAAPAELSGALRTVGGAAPAAALSSFASGVDHRIARITAAPPPLSLPLRVLVRVAAPALVVAPVLALLVA